MYLLNKHSNRTAVSKLSKSGVEDQQFLKIACHINQNFIKTYSNYDEEQDHKYYDW